jgi:phosphatidylinositol alpha-1,6-mannosyltransferase
MKYLLITLEYPPYHGGVANYYSNLVKHSPEKITVMTNESGRLVDDRWPVVKWLPSLWWIALELKRNSYRYLLVGQILPVGTAVWALSYLFNFKYGVFLHGLDLSLAQATPVKLWLTKHILERADKIISANSRTAQEAKKLLPGSAWGKVAVVNPGIDVKPLVYDEAIIKNLKKRYQLESATVFLTVARLVKRKGVDTVLRALAEARKINPNLAYVIIGQGEEADNLRHLISDLKLEACVKLLTRIDDVEKTHWLQLCDVFVMVSRDLDGDYEGFGIVYLEAGLAGKPVIAGNSGGVADAVIDDETGIMIEPDNLQALTDVILELAEFEGLRRRLGDAGRLRAINNFNWNNQAKKIFDLISHS